MPFDLMPQAIEQQLLETNINKEAADLLRGARRRLQKGFVTTAMAVDRIGALVSPDSPDAVAYCSIGALIAEMTTRQICDRHMMLHWSPNSDKWPHVGQLALHHLQAVIGGTLPIYAWNDCWGSFPVIGKFRVLRAFKRAAVRAEHAST